MIKSENYSFWLRPPSVVSRGWRGQIKGVKELLSHDDNITIEKIVEIGKGIGTAIRLGVKNPWPKPNEDAIFEVLELASAFEYVDDIYELNELLEELYDWGDDYRVIIG